MINRKKRLKKERKLIRKSKIEGTLANARVWHVPVAQLEERSPPEAEAARSNRAGYTNLMILSFNWAVLKFSIGFNSISFPYENIQIIGAGWRFSDVPVPIRGMPGD